AQSRGVAASVVGHRFLKALDVCGRDLGFGFGALKIDIGEDGPFLQFDLGLGEVGFGLSKIRNAFLGVCVVLGDLLFDLMAQVLKLGLGLAGGVDLLGGV